MTDVAQACVAAMAAGHDVELSVPAWRRAGLSKAIAAALQASGQRGGSWRFVAVDGEDDPPDAQDMLGWGPAPAGVVAVQVPPQDHVGPPASTTPSRAPEDAVAEMMSAAYAVFAQAQPVMTAGLHPGQARRVNHGAPATGRPAMSAALAELADLDF